MHLSDYRPTGAVFEKGQFIAKAIQLVDSTEWQFFAGRVNGLTKNGPWLYFLGDHEQIKQVQLACLAC